MSLHLEDIKTESEKSKINPEIHLEKLSNVIQETKDWEPDKRQKIIEKAQQQIGNRYNPHPIVKDLCEDSRYCQALRIENRKDIYEIILVAIAQYFLQKDS